VDPVPVGVAKAMAADVVIAVDLNSGLISRREVRKQAQMAENTESQEPEYKYELLKKLSDYYENAEASFKTKINDLFHKEEEIPDIIDTVMTSINIMQERITRINLAVEPPDILVQPRLGELKMMDFDQVDHAIEEGYLGVMERIDDIKAFDTGLKRLPGTRSFTFNPAYSKPLQAPESEGRAPQTMTKL
jgi:NTE family protein